MEESKSKKGFNSAMIALLLFVLAFIVNFFGASSNSETLNLGIGMLEIVAILVGVFGLINSIRGLKEPNSMEQIVGITVNGVLTVVLIWVIGEVIARLN
ncbi:hypothetical protein L1S35_05175 [Flavobacterium sp. AS60]|uniref:hypothetical protein n=1 Tax=Flavobacterium anseongense TaxID=2910677 RepID=UPI001F16F9F7|nr:hypothetical protein [Flavobacterium sp. AS60]MCF6129056.1 hypothetical protein [Flavobacterium sp. AS60]